MRQAYEDVAPTLTLPPLVLQRSDDPALDSTAASTFLERTGSTDKTLRALEGHGHALTSEPGADAIIDEEVLPWIERHVGPSITRV